jgi:hypothetical protein
MKAKLTMEIPVVDSEIGIRVNQPIEFSRGHAVLEIKNVMKVELGFVNELIPLLTIQANVEQLNWARLNFCL